MNRLQILERFGLARRLEAEVQHVADGRRAFVEVRPQLNEKIATLRHADFGVEPILIRANPNADVIMGYCLRYCLLDPGWEQESGDWDHYLVQDDRVTYATLDELERALFERFRLSLDSLVVPGNTDSPL